MEFRIRVDCGFETRLAALLLSVAIAGTAFADSHWNTLIPTPIGKRLTLDDPVEYGVFYTRLIRLEHSGKANGRLIATYEHFPTPFDIFRSDDDGLTWSKVAKTPRGHMPAPWTFEGEPHLYELPVAVKDMPAGTILLVGSAVKDHADGKHLEQRLELYSSADQGVTWTYRGLADSTQGIHGAIWEPNIVVAANGDLVIYYSDERLQPTYSQVLAERVSTDGGRTWGPQKNIVAVPDGRQRPGMAVVQKLANGKYVMSYEWINGEMNPAYIRFSDDGINWGDPKERGIPVKTANGSTLGGTPYVLWTPYGGPKGALIVNARDLNHSPNTDREFFVNFNMGEGPWIAQPSPVQWQGNQEFDGWSMGMIPTADGQGLILAAPSYAGNDANEVLIGCSPILVPGKNYTILNEASGLALGIPGDSKVHGTLVKLVKPDGRAGQVWTLTDLGDSKFAFLNPASGLALDDYELKIRNGAPVGVWDKNLLTVQQWKPLPCGDGTFKLLNVNANRVIGVWDRAKTVGASIVFWDDIGSPDQKWKLVPAK